MSKYMDGEDYVREAGFDLIDSTAGGIGYEWSTVDVWRSPDGHVFVYADSGCSCNGPYQSLTMVVEDGERPDPARVKSMLAPLHTLAEWFRLVDEHLQWVRPSPEVTVAAAAKVAAALQNGGTQ